jgi:hypothetical protein
MAPRKEKKTHVGHLSTPSTVRVYNSASRLERGLATIAKGKRRSAQTLGVTRAAKEAKINLKAAAATVSRMSNALCSLRLADSTK